ncbi:rhomboid family intramembrane serine protease [Mesobacillus sp. AQ2]|jgi:rhomboid protease GluP|uniref:rhomboid family intramembrane serine protease n=1 Tax=Bacillaceae TaxID=186817 RepID=UPI0011A40DEB|nr:MULTISPECIES: rhomboid family intramembrane serine protease [Bacillaceae]MCM3125664.1 rhomboid family intramembrane serine protease [Mesobacillus sp. MER 33]MCM3235685.1 rhomboid family intramembrane serine protease [Mesobacillus sp. MER 48]WHX40835.1 rhomboid family intramembrane serine protease [Mesobacillus sp. AQ2]
MFTRTENLRDYIRFYPVITFIIFIHILLYLLTALPIFPSKYLFERLAGVNLYVVNGEYWRIVTPIFMHAGFAHMLFNSFSLVLFGPALEQLLGRTKFILVYLVTGIAANLATLLLEPLTYTHVGSSGAIFGLFGFYISIIMFRKAMMSRENSQTIMTIAIIAVIMTFVQSNINITAHIFGMLSGFLIGAAAYRR